MLFVFFVIFIQKNALFLQFVENFLRFFENVSYYAIEIYSKKVVYYISMEVSDKK